MTHRRSSQPKKKEEPVIEALPDDILAAVTAPIPEHAMLIPYFVGRRCAGRAQFRRGRRTGGRSGRTNQEDQEDQEELAHAPLWQHRSHHGRESRTYTECLSLLYRPLLCW